MPTYTIDRFEGNKAVLLLKGNEATEELVDRSVLPESAKEGDLIETSDNDGYRILHKETEKRRQQAKAKLEALKNRPNSK
ncbi:DUF3006 domain-containing protein [Halobacillus litoralis]|uniref:DUF3006 domain-containing protein n=1 Tax=Halobacillus litoralis TaxID=45668 RepID=UPI001CFF0F59|nr:DUF3006 domain-containing protein [Halobacillus litoralis]WLR49028.1 DUF3006 domain-containing protein [Halobacillus litoralis]